MSKPIKMVGLEDPVGPKQVPKSGDLPGEKLEGDFKDFPLVIGVDL